MPSPLSDVLTLVRPDTLGEPYMAQIFRQAQTQVQARSDEPQQSWFLVLVTLEIRTNPYL